jgi:amidase
VSQEAIVFPEYANYDALGLAELVRRRQVVPSDLVEAAIERIDRHNPKLNAVIFKAYDEARARAAGPLSGPFAGVPFLLKDILGFKKGWPSRQGSHFLPAVPWPHDSTLVRRYETAGLVALGTTNVPEFGLLPVTEPSLYGPARNPWNLAHSPGGSSGGAAAAVSAGIVPLAHANDGGGSIRIPASACGLVGLKPTRARNPLGPDIGDILGGLVVEHVVSRSVRDSAAALDATAGPDIGDPYAAPPAPGTYLAATATPTPRLRIAYAKDIFGSPLHPECCRAVEAAAHLCAGLGHAVEEGAPPLAAERFAEVFTPIWASGIAMTIDLTARVTGRLPSPRHFQSLTWSFYEHGKSISAAQYQMCWAALHRMGREVAAFHQRYDVWLTPTLGRPPLRVGEFNKAAPDLASAIALAFAYVPFTALQNVTGQPAVNIPLHWEPGGLPVGVQFVGRVGEEHTLLSLAAELEHAQPWSARTPTLWN